MLTLDLGRLFWRGQVHVVTETLSRDTKRGESSEEISRGGFGSTSNFSPVSCVLENTSEIYKVQRKG